MERIDSGTSIRALFGRAATRRLEADATESLAPQELMRRAGAAVARLALALAPHAQRVWIAAGPGNNGGDGLEAALQLREWGKDAGVLLVGDAAALPVDAAAAFARARAGGVAVDVRAGSLGRNDIAIDALLGIGASRAPTDRLADTIRTLNALACPVLAIDVPSGLDVDTGQPFGADCLRARATLALLTLKPGLFTADGRDAAGHVWFDALGVDMGRRKPDAWLAGTGADRPSAVRPHASHKGSFGDVAVVGGASGMIGAALLAARAAHAAGAGRVYVGLLGAPRASGLDPQRPELMFRPDWCNEPAHVLAGTTVVCGCGGGNAVHKILPRLLSLVRWLVLDADALNAVAADSGLQSMLVARARRGLQTVLTPHPLEAARLLDRNTGDVQADRLRAAHALAHRYAATVVLKGSGTVVAAPDRVPVLAATGNAALASAGTGDVLAGWLGGLWAQADRAAADSAFESAWRAVVDHGAAGEPPAPGALRAADLVEVLYRRLRDG